MFGLRFALCIQSWVFPLLISWQVAAGDCQSADNVAFVSCFRWLSMLSSSGSVWHGKETLFCAAESLHFCLVEGRVKVIFTEKGADCE